MHRQEAPVPETFQLLTHSTPEPLIQTYKRKHFINIWGELQLYSRKCPAVLQLQVIKTLPISASTEHVIGQFKASTGGICTRKLLS